MPDPLQSAAPEWSHSYDFQRLMAKRVENIILVSR